MLLMKRYFTSIILVFGLLFSFELKAQLTCNFSADTLEGCAPLRVNFTDLSAGGGTIVYRNWDFGNGGFSNTNNPSPSRVYANSGQFTVTLTVSDGIDTASKTVTNYITVFKNPVVGFNFQKITNCAPIEVRFTDQTTLGDAPIKNYSWDYGDLTGAGTAKNPTHFYNFKGTYSVILSVEDTNGCKGSFERKDIVAVEKPEAKFGASKRSDCKAPMTTNFINNSTGLGTLTYNWTFGDGNTSTATSPTHTYTNTGSYDVSLVVTDSNGCTDTLAFTKLISIGQTKADFTSTDTICLNQPDSFINTSIGGQNFLWTFGGTDTSTSIDPVYAFSSAGIKTVTLIASSGPGCIDTITKSVYVQEIEADYRVTYPDKCKPNLVSVFDSSRKVTAVSGIYYWVQGTSPKQINGLDTAIEFPASGCTRVQRQLTYTAESKFGCRDTVTKNIIEYQNSAVGIQQVASGDHCVKDTVGYRFSGCLVNGARSFSWDFGTGKAGDTSNLRNPTNVIVLDTSGVYTSTLTVQDSAGCSYKARSSYQVGEKPNASFIIQDDTLCFMEQFIFKSNSTDSTKIDQYTWEFGDSQGGQGKQISHIYDSIGVYNVKLTADDNMCRDDTTISLYISGPSASIGNNNTGSCLFPLRQSFSLNSFGYFNRFYWDFGDTSAIDSTTLNPVHTYAQEGTYKVKLRVINDTTGCEVNTEYTVQPFKVIADIQAFDIICSDSSIQLDGTKSSGNIGFNFFWDFDNGLKSTRNPRPKTNYNSPGIYDVELIVIGADSCSDTATFPVHVLPNAPAFELPQLNFCHGDTLMINATDSFGVHAPKSSGPGIYSNYFDSTTNAFIGSPHNQFFFWKRNDTSINNNSAYFEQVLLVDSTKARIGHQTDTLKLSLKSVDSSYHYFYRLQPQRPERYEYGDFQGCVQDTEVEIIIHQLNPIFRMEDSTICIGDSIWFQDTSQATVGSYTWYFGNGDSSSLSSPEYAFGQRGTYNVTYVTRASVCEDSLVIPVNVQAVDSLKFYASLTDTTCFPATSLFFDQSVGDSITWRYWDFGDGRTPIRSPLKDSLTKTFTDPGEFSVKLIVETSYGCQDSITYDKYINIRGPYAEFSLSDDSICLYDEVTYRLDTVNQYTYSLEWDFSDGFVDTTDTTVQQIVHRYNKTGRLSPVLVYRDSALTCERAFTEDLVIESVLADFTISDSIGCAPLSVDFDDKSVDGDTWRWTFGDGNIGSIANPKNTYSNEGKYEVFLYYENSKNNCKDTAVGSLNVLSNPQIKAFGDSLICRGDSISLSATGAKNYRWTPTSYMNNRAISNPRVAPLIDQLYFVEGIDSNNCRATDSVIVVVQQLPVIQLPNDTNIIIGEEFIPKIEVTNGASYRWEPIAGIDCDTCKLPKFDPVESTTYTLFVKDSLGCFEISRSFFVNVDEKYSIDVAEGFTPNGDGVNDIIYPDGWGLENVLEFKVFNRWGEIVFESTAAQMGWDGYYKGALQNQDTYLWFVKATAVSGEEISEEGFFTLFR